MCDPSLQQVLVEAVAAARQKVTELHSTWRSRLGTVEFAVTEPRLLDHVSLPAVSELAERTTRAARQRLDWLAESRFAEVARRTASGQVFANPVAPPSLTRSSPREQVLLQAANTLEHASSVLAETAHRFRSWATRR